MNWVIVEYDDNAVWSVTGPFESMQQAMMYRDTVMQRQLTTRELFGVRAVVECMNAPVYKP